MSAASVPPESARRRVLLDAAYSYVLEHGLATLSLRPLAVAIGSSPRVLLYLFGSKDGLVQEILARARTEELAVLDRVRHAGTARGPGAAAEAIWGWLAAPERRALLTLWVEGYGRALVEPDGAWAGFAERTVHDWLAVLDDVGGGDEADRTLLLAVLRGALLDLLATGDVARTGAAVQRFLVGGHLLGAHLLGADGNPADPTGPVP